MLHVVNYMGRFLLWILMGSWADTGSGRARNFTLAVGSLALGLALGFISNRWCKLDSVSSYAGIPAGAIILTFVIESVKKEVQKPTGGTST